MIGTTQLKDGDPPIGVVSGELIPDENYEKYKSLFINQNYPAIKELNLSVRTETGESLEPCSGVGIIHYDEADEALIEVNVLGLDLGIYQKFFPHLIQAYERSLSK